MDKSWMNLTSSTQGRLSPEYKEGVMNFITFAARAIDDSGKFRCPCNDCRNAYSYYGHIVVGHLIAKGIMQSYKVWCFHGEIIESTIRGDFEMESDGEDDFAGIHALVDDRIRADINETDPEILVDNDSNESMHKFDKLLKDAQSEVYPGCTEFNLLKFVISLMNIKVVTKWSNKGLNMMLEFLKKLLPKENIVPKSMYEVKKILRELGLGYERIDACKNDCILFWKETANLDSCPVCKESRYKSTNCRGKTIPNKVLRWLPLKPRLQRLFMSKKIAHQMKWHSDRKDKNDGFLRHPSDGLDWQDFDAQNSDFAKEARNVRLGFASDGFNPFGQMSTAYSMWPVIMMPYNLPPWMGMKESFFMMPLLIPGPNAPGRDIDVYLRPLVDELKDLWEDGELTYDASTGKTFRMRAAVMWTIHDFPAYGDISGWTTKGYYACPSCNDSPLSVGLNGKIGFCGHRCYLPVDDPWRQNKSFDGKVDNKVGTLELPRQKVIEQLERMPPNIFGKISGKKRPRDERTYNWSKKSILYELPYWGTKTLKHNIDVMHVEKNICENLCGTLLGLDKKNKDTIKARMDLEKMKIRPELHLIAHEDGSFEMPQANYLLTPIERDSFYKFVKSIKYPDGYAGSISRSVNPRHGSMLGLKSHDYHVLLQKILPIGMRGFLNKEIRSILFELGDFFENMCSTTLKISDLEKLEEGIVRILCKLEKVFPPAFFDVMVHLAVHLPREAMYGGPIQYRWMYPIERALGTLKEYVSNRARPEGSIVEAYILKECTSFCSLYLDDGIETVFYKPDRNDDRGERTQEGLLVFSETARPTGHNTRDELMSMSMLNLAHWWLLSNTPEVDPFLKEYKRIINVPFEHVFNLLERQQFIHWFKQHANELHHSSSSLVGDQLWYLANGPTSVRRYSGCVVNGLRFRTRELDDERVTQNSGVCVIAPYENNEEHEFYGHLCKVWEIDFMCNHSTVLFECAWYDTSKETGRRATIHRDLYCTSVNVESRWCKEDPFVLPSQTRQVFYVNDTKYEGNWRVVIYVKARSNFDFPDLGGVEEPCSTSAPSNDAFQQTVSMPPIELEDANFNNLDHRPTSVQNDLLNSES